MDSQEQNGSKASRAPMAMLATAAIILAAAIFAEYNEDDSSVLTKAQWERYLDLRD